VVALQQIVSRNANPAMHSVLSFGKVIAAGATNVLPDEVKMEGTFRTMDETWREEAHKRMIKMAQGIAESMGGSVDFEIRRGYPFLKNDEVISEICREAAEEYVGTENVKPLDIWMAAEDFAYYSQEVPSCFYRLGTRNEEKGTGVSVHNAKFDVDEDAIEQGAGLFAYMAIKHLL
jgi:amidohydrolase